MFIDCPFNPEVDFAQVVPGLSVNVTEALTTLSVDPIGVDTTAFTKETDVNNVGHYLRDNFDIAMAYKSLSVSQSNAPTQATVQEPSSK